jgi:hypothetical protein
MAFCDISQEWNVLEIRRSFQTANLKGTEQLEEVEVVE